MALLVLSVGFGSALLLYGASPAEKAQITPSATPSARASTLLTTPDDPDQQPAQPYSPLPTQPDAAVAPQDTPAPTFTSGPSPTPRPTETPLPTLAPERYGGPVTVPDNHKGQRWVTLQAGHWRNQNLPPELEHLTENTGAFAAGVSEVDVNVQVAKLTAKSLAERGYGVEVLDATVPPNYSTDLFLALHADGSVRTSIRGFKAVAPWSFPPASDKFVGFLYEEYGKATGLPTDARTSDSMANYYAFNPLKYHHALNPHVPSALLEMGFVTNPLDRLVLTTEQERLALGIANAVDRYFRSGAAGATPSPYPTFTPTITPTRTQTATPSPSSTPSPTVTHTSTPVPPVIGIALTRTAIVATQMTATSTPHLPTTTRTPLPTATPLTGTITTDGRWLPPMSPNGRNLPAVGSNAGRVLLSRASDDPHQLAEDRAITWRPFIWMQYYVPTIGRSIWVKGRYEEGKE